jgi:hypothetical protein
LVAEDVLAGLALPAAVFLAAGAAWAGAGLLAAGAAWAGAGLLAGGAALAGAEALAAGTSLLAVASAGAEAFAAGVAFVDLPAGDFEGVDSGLGDLTAGALAAGDFAGSGREERAGAAFAGFAGFGAPPGAGVSAAGLAGLAAATGLAVIERDGVFAPAGAFAVDTTLATGVALALVAIGASFPFAPADLDAFGAGMLAVVVGSVVVTIGQRSPLPRKGD